MVTVARDGSATATAVLMVDEPMTFSPSDIQAVERMREIWNRKCPGHGLHRLAELRHWPDNRIEAAKNFLFKKIDGDFDRWERLIDHVLKDSLMTGGAPAKKGYAHPWAASFDWLLEQANILKVMEGR